MASPRRLLLAGSRSAILALAAITLADARLGAQAAAPDRQLSPRSAWDSGWHVVRPGDTLEGLAERFLGSSQLWRELHGLNTWVKDPDLLYPGQRLQIFLDRPTPEPSAQVISTSRKVSELPRPAPWRPAAEGDVLIEKDGLRTEKSASARLRFDDDAVLTLSEDSLIFIRRQSRSSAAAPKKEIEIQVGQADVESAPKTGRSDTIEVIVGSARSVSAAENGKPLRSRSRRDESSSAQFMVYDGQSTVSAAGQKVDVPAGSGTTVAPKAAPGPPEILLPAPTGLEPIAGGEFDRSAPRLAWKPIAGAAGYVVEVCRDPACGSLVEIARGIPHADYAPREHLDGSLYWRVTAVAPSGLDGFPSPAQAMVAVDAVAPPAPSVALRTQDGRSIAANACVAVAPDLQVNAADRAGRPLAWELLVDGEQRSLAEFRSAQLAGAHSVAVRAKDDRGRAAVSSAVPFILDGAAPWAELQLDPESTADQPTVEPKRRRKARQETPVADCSSSLEVRDASDAWRQVPCSTSQDGDTLALALRPDEPYVEFRTATPRTLGGRGLASGEIVRLDAWDVGCGLSSLGVRIAGSGFAPGRMLLVAEVQDLAGNRRELGWHLGN